MPLTKHQFLRLPLLCVLLLCLLASQNGYTWCIGADGHNHTLAPVEEHSDSHQATHCDDQDPGLDVSPDEHGQCLHIAVSTTWDQRSTRDSLVLDASAAAARAPVLAATGLLPAPLLTNGLIPEPSPRITEPILLHRTTVLLI
jgi:hypothetical protein